MKLIVKILVVFIVLAAFLALVYYFFGNQAELIFSRENCVAWFSEHRQFAWAAGILLLVSDILLPVPATGVMAAIGTVYGLWGGTLINIAGSASAGLAGYLIARGLGKRGSRYIATEQELERFKAFFDHWGGYAIIISRVMPILPEVTAILAGLSKMKFPRFLAALLAGTVPVSFFFTLLGTNAFIDPGIGMMIAVVVPVIIWPVFIKKVKI